MAVQRPTPPGRHLFSADKDEFTTEEAALYIGRSKSTVRGHVRAGNIKAHARGGLLDNRYWYFLREDLDRLYEFHSYRGAERK